jgi:hypothetical protein
VVGAGFAVPVDEGLIALQGLDPRPGILARHAWRESTARLARNSDGRSCSGGLGRWRGEGTCRDCRQSRCAGCLPRANIRYRSQWEIRMPARNIVVVCSGSHEKKVNLGEVFPGLSPLRPCLTDRSFVR